MGGQAQRHRSPPPVPASTPHLTPSQLQYWPVLRFHEARGSSELPLVAAALKASSAASSSWACPAARLFQMHMESNSNMLTERVAMAFAIYIWFGTRGLGKCLILIGKIRCCSLMQFRPCLVSKIFQLCHIESCGNSKIFKISRHIEFLDACMEY